LVIQIAHIPSEINLDLGEAPIKFVDLETNEVLKLQPQEIHQTIQRRNKFEMSFMGRRFKKHVLSNSCSR